jgi:hypothetical protein
MRRLEFGGMMDMKRRSHVSLNFAVEIASYWFCIIVVSLTVDLSHYE